ncbi:MAG: NADP oxidoreductase [Anaerolineae bacterium]|nr:NADP oxidoreductase [Anaerolineae bacterium]
MSKKKIATIWMDGCSGCHMSFLDLDHRLLDLADLIEIVHSPIVDHKEFPPDVDVTLVEGAVSSDEDYEKIVKVRARTKILVAMGDCAVSANVPAMRNRFTPKALQEAVYLAPNMARPQLPHEAVPTLLPRVRPVHEVVKVDVFVPGCPPSNDTLFYVLSELVHGRMPDLSNKTRFGA